MSNQSPTPADVTPNPPSPGADGSPLAEQPVPRASQRLLVALLLPCIALIGWRWYADRYRLEPLVATDSVRPIDLNRASKAELMQLPGVGPQTADKIIDYRQAHGGFERLDQLEQVPGIGSKTFDKLKVYLTLAPRDAEAILPEPDRLTRQPKEVLPNPGSTKPSLNGNKINVNRASITELQSLPGIGPVLAGRMIEERDKKAFITLDDVKRVPGIGPKKFDAIKDSITID